jgi:CDP-glycerol glycerophosphotransferase (TagB/SpsB family)
MTKTLVALEPRIELNTNATLHQINRLRNYIERCWIRDIPDAEIIQEVSTKNPQYAHEQCLKLCQNWYRYGELPRLLQYLQVNMGTVLEGYIWFLLYPLLQQIDAVEDVVSKADIVYAESDFTPLGKAVESVANAKGIEYQFFEPLWYREIKNQTKAYWHSRMRKETLIPSSLFNVSDGKSGRKILFDAPHYTNYFNALYPVVKQMTSQNNCYVYGEQLHVCNKFKNSVRIPINSYINYFTDEIIDYYAKLERDNEFHRLFTYKNIPIWDAVQQDMSYILNKTLIDIVADLSYFQSVLKYCNPDVLVVAFDESPSMRGHVLLAKQLGIPTLEVQHGLLSTMSLYANPISDMFASGGESGKAVYVSAGVPGKNVIITGFPKNDIYSSLDRNKPTNTILFATNPTSAKMNLSIIEMIGDWIKDSELKLVVKPHPYESHKIYQPLVRKYKNVVLRASSDDIAPLIEQSDIVVMENSTVGIEALIMNKLLVCLSINRSDIPVYVSSDVALDVKTYEDIIPTIKEGLYDSTTKERLGLARKQFVYQYAYLQDGEASERVADLILKMADKKDSR